jgi:hypothetical protein
LDWRDRPNAVIGGAEANIPKQTLQDPARDSFHCVLVFRGAADWRTIPTRFGLPLMFDGDR